MCPQCAGRITTSAKTWKNRNRPTKANLDVPYVGNIDDEYCCRGTVTIPVDKLDTYQDIPYGTPAWQKRLRAETTNSMLKDKGGLKAGWCRAFGLAAHTIGALALAIAHNVKETIGIERTQTEKPAPPARPKSHQPTRRNILADSLTPRAPPD